MKKRIIICCDGTWNNLEMRYITNVGRLVQALTAEGISGQKPIPQLVYYNDGVGADASGLRRVVEGAVGGGIDNLIYEAYRFICINYNKGDEICLFGFSRGAFTVRSVAGMIGRIGLVPRSRLKHMPEAMEVYRSKKAGRQAAFSGDIKCLKTKIDLLGCWDTVGALGIPDKLPWLPIDDLFRKRYEFHDIKLGKNIKRAIHAVGIDEQRKEFNATLMEKAEDAPASQKLVQTWFPGIHGCVGGGRWENRGLSNHCLKWMIETAAQLGTKIGVDWTQLHDKAISDASIFFSREIKLLYGRINRPLKNKHVKWENIDDTVKERWARNDDYRPPALKKRFAAKLDNWAADHAGPSANAAHQLAIGESRDLRVFSRDKNGQTGLNMQAGEGYELIVSRLQVWKDGKLDPCDIQGWNLSRKKNEAKTAYEDGEPADKNRLSSWLIRSANKKRLVPGADWFELVYRTGTGKHARLDIRKPAEETEPYRVKLKVQHPGELALVANDLASRVDFIDKYDNNSGWIWVTVTRTA